MSKQEVVVIFIILMSISKKIKNSIISKAIITIIIKLKILIIIINYNYENNMMCVCAAHTHNQTHAHTHTHTHTHHSHEEHSQLSQSSVSAGHAASAPATAVAPESPIWFPAIVAQTSGSRVREQQHAYAHAHRRTWQHIKHGNSIQSATSSSSSKSRGW